MLIIVCSVLIDSIVSGSGNNGTRGERVQGSVEKAVIGVVDWGLPGGVEDGVGVFEAKGFVAGE